MSTNNDENQSNNNNDDNNSNDHQQDQRPDWLPEKFKSVEDFAKSYTELEKRLHGNNKTDDTSNDDNDDNFDPFAELVNNNSSNADALETYFNKHSDLGIDISEFINDIADGKVSPENKKILEEKIKDKNKIKEFIDNSKKALSIVSDFNTQVDNTFNEIFKDASKDAEEFFNNEENASDPKYADLLNDYAEAYQNNDLKALKVATQALRVAYEKYEKPLIGDDSVLNKIFKRQIGGDNSSGNENGSQELYNSISEYNADIDEAMKTNDYAKMEQADKKYELSRKYKRI